jgi:alkylated DNA repair dioxygenase AlkB
MRMSWAGHKAVWSQPDDHSPPSPSELDGLTTFNELLSLGYMEGDSISVSDHSSPESSIFSDTLQYHDDGEGTLGPTVATLSLGSPALMSFRMKSRVAKDDREVLKFPIYHGDIVVMHGEDIHKYFEVCLSWP